jgi:hypothetical protein
MSGEGGPVPARGHMPFRGHRNCAGEAWCAECKQFRTTGCRYALCPVAAESHEIASEGRNDAKA